MNNNTSSNGNIIQDQSQTGDLIEEEFDIWNYIRFLTEERWLIAGVTTIIFLLGILYAYNSTPIYRTDALLQVEEIKPTLQGLEELSAAFGGVLPTVTEIEIIRSRSIIGAAVDKLGLTIIERPRYFPLFGKSSAKKYKNSDTLAEPFWGLSNYAWGGERLEIEQLDLPRSYIGNAFILTALKDNGFTLTNTNGEILLEGSIGKLEEKDLEEGGKISIFVKELYARPGTEFDIVKLSQAKIIKNFQGKLGVKEKGRNTGILELYMEGENPNKITKIVNTIANTYVRQNAERRSAEAESTLQFLNKQLPALKSKLDTAESNLNNYRSTTGKINLTLETQSLLDGATNVEQQIQSLKLKRSELKQKYTANHPILLGVKRKINRLENEKLTIGRQIKALPDAEQLSIQLMRDVKVANELYLLLLNKAQELKVIKAGTIGNVRILDTAILPENPIKPRKFLILMVSLILGFMGGITSASIRRNLLRGITDPNWLESTYGVSVYASILHSKKQESIEKKYEKYGKDDLPILALEEPKDLSIEALRSFRTSLQFVMMEAKNNIIAISGSSPTIGKSFICVNLPYVLADTEKTVLVIDGDMRRGHIHRYFSVDRSPGLSEYITGNSKLNDIIRTGENKNISYISSGTIPPNPSELLSSKKFKELLDKLSSNYDVILIDTPPILAVTDGILISQLAGAVFLVLKSGIHHPKEIDNMLRRLSQNNINANGFIFNDVPISAIGRYGYKYNYYNYKY